MADPNQNNQQQLGNTGNILSDLQGKDYANLRKAITDGYSDALVRNNNDPRNKSQSVFQDRRNEMQMEKNSNVKKAGDYKRTGNILDDFEQGIKDELMDALAGGDFKKGVNSALSEFTKQFGFELKDLPHELGKTFGKQLADSRLGQSFKENAQKLGNNLLNKIFDNTGDQKAAKDALSKAMNKFFETNGGQGAQAASSAASSLGSGAGGAGILSASQSLSGGEIGAQLSKTGITGTNSAALKGIASKVASVVPIAAIIAIVYMLLKPAFDGIGNVVKAWASAWNKDEDMRKKRLANAQERIKEDYNYLVKEPFEILTNAAKKWEETWDANLAKISLTQGYTKEDVYDLYESVSKKLYSDHLESAISATDIISNLTSVLESGLSGTIAEEFAYEATKLGAMIPTQNFIGYASTYAQLASEARSTGMSQYEAIQYANQELELFASNLLYSSRTLSGGFTTGLQDAQTLFKDAVEIAQTAKTSNAAQISGTLTAVSGIIGAVAPDLAQGLVQNIVSAAIGGNSDTIVALRSLSGMNAGNTEFLKQLANDPQGLFVTIFKSLGELQSMSPENYMEVAEGLSSVFGVDMKALARVDFNNLANQLANMQVNQASLDENLALLQSGEATMSTEQVKLQEINNMILEEGLAYVIDSEAGRMVQEHMWQEQMTNALMENEYAVNLQGSALSFLEGIRHAIANILNFLNPIGYVVNGVSQMIAVEQQRLENNEDIKELLEKTAVGRNSYALNNLLTTGQDLKLVSSLAEMYGIDKSERSTGWDVIQNALPYIGAYGGAAWLTGGGPLTVPLGNALMGGGIYSGATWNAAVDSIGGLHHTGFNGPNSYYEATGTGIGSRSSQYSGFTVGKSAAQAYKPESSRVLPDVKREVTSATDASQAKLEASVHEWINSAEEAAKSGQSQAKWWSSAKDVFGIEDIESALKDLGYTAEQAKGYYDEYSSGIAGQAEANKKQNIQDFIEENRRFWDYNTGTSGIFESAIWIPFVNNEFKPFFDEGKRFDIRMDAIDTALVLIQDKEDIISDKLGDNSKFTVISVLEAIQANMYDTFVKDSSDFQKCLAAWVQYITDVKAYQNEVSNAQAWNDLKAAEGDAQQETLLALANAMNVFSADELKKLDPQLQANALLGQIVIILQTIMQQNSNLTGGGFSMAETMAGLGMGITYKTGT